MPKVDDAHREARREHIIDAALRCFMRNGYARTSMADIISESGLSAGAIYSYFEGKEELFRAVAARVLAQRTSELAESAEHGPISPADVMATFLEGMRRELLTPVVIQLWGEATVDPQLRSLVNDVLMSLRETIVATLLSWAAAHPESVPEDAEQWAHHMAMTMACFGPGFILQSTIVDDFDPEAVLQTLKSFFVPPARS